MNYGEALVGKKHGAKVRRPVWKGIQFVVMMPPLKLPPYSNQEPGPKVNDRTAKYIGVDTPLDSQPYFAAFTTDGLWQPGWMPSNADILAEDWELA